MAGLTRAGEERSLGQLLRAGVQLRPLIRDWRASTADMLQRFLGDDEAAKFAIAGNIGYYADDPRRLAWPFFAMAQAGFLKAGGRFIKGGSRVLTMKLARAVTGPADRFCSAGTFRRSSSTLPVILPSSGTWT